MPGIVAILGADNRVELAELLEAALGRMRHHDSYRQQGHVLAAEGVALGRVDLGLNDAATQPAFSADGLVALVMDGELYDQAALRDRLRRSGCRLASPTDRCLFDG